MKSLEALGLALLLASAQGSAAKIQLSLVRRGFGFNLNEPALEELSGAAHSASGHTFASGAGPSYSVYQVPPQLRDSQILAERIHRPPSGWDFKHATPESVEARFQGLYRNHLEGDSTRVKWKDVPANAQQKAYIKWHIARDIDSEEETKAKLRSERRPIPRESRRETLDAQLGVDLRAMAGSMMARHRNSHLEDKTHLFVDPPGPQRASTSSPSPPPATSRLRFKAARKHPYGPGEEPFAPATPMGPRRH